MPTIYLAGGILDCGPHFTPDQCDAFSRGNTGAWEEYEITGYATVTDSVSVLVIVTNEKEVTLYSTSTQWATVGDSTFIVTIASLYKMEYATITSTVFHSGTSPSLVPTLYTQSPGTVIFSTAIRKFTETAYAPSIVTPTATMPNTRQKKRTYDYDRCGGPPDHDLLTNSLTDVCHFIANIQVGNGFVSLKPTTAAYMPSWIGYLVRVLTAMASLTSVYVCYCAVLPFGS